MNATQEAATAVAVEKPLIFRRIIDLIRDVEPVGKNHRNQQQGYNFRGIDDIYNLVNPLMQKHGIFCTSRVLDEKREERESRSGGLLIYTWLKVEFRWFAEDGSFVTSVVPGEGMDSADKSTGKAMSGAYKYAWMQITGLPTEAVDAENDTPQPQPRKPNGGNGAARPAARPESPAPQRSETQSAPQDGVVSGVIEAWEKKEGAKKDGKKWHRRDITIAGQKFGVFVGSDTNAMLAELFNAWEAKHPVRVAVTGGQYPNITKLIEVVKGAPATDDPGAGFADIPEDAPHEIDSTVGHIERLGIGPDQAYGALVNGTWFHTCESEVAEVLKKAKAARKPVAIDFYLDADGRTRRIKNVAQVSGDSV